MIPYNDAAAALCRSVLRNGSGPYDREANEVIRRRIKLKIQGDHLAFSARADDITQDAICKFLFAAERGLVDCGRAPGRYLLVIVDNICRDLQREAVRQASRIDLAEPAQAEDPASRVIGRVDAAAAVGSGIRAAHEAGDEVAVAVLQSFEDAAYAVGDPSLSEVARQAGRSVPTVRNVLSAFRDWLSDPTRGWSRRARG
jgi:DNA-directed RNA polymerase specialized sigma24 family protein